MNVSIRLLQAFSNGIFQTVTQSDKVIGNGAIL